MKSSSGSGKTKPNKANFKRGNAKVTKIQVFALTGVHTCACATCVEANSGAGRQAKALHSLIAWSAATFRNGPSDIVEGTLSLPRLAVQTAGCFSCLCLCVAVGRADCGFFEAFFKEELADGCT